MPMLALNPGFADTTTIWRDHAQLTTRFTPMPVGLCLLGLAIRLLGLVPPGLAARWVYRLWLQPIRFPEPQQEKDWRRTSRPLAVVHRGRELAVYSWGAGSPVLMVHGWNGRGAQLGAFAPVLVQAGYRVVAFDTPAHGRSPGRATNPPEISDALHEV